MVVICINNSLPVNTLSFVLVICLMDAADIERAKNKIKRHHSGYYKKICIHILPCINAPEIFIENTASYPTKSSQKRCPINMTTLFDQSFFDRLVLQVNVWTPFDKQHLSMYVPAPSQVCEGEQCPRDQV